MLTRRSFLAGLFAAPAIVRASVLMPVRAFRPLINNDEMVLALLKQRIRDAYAVTRQSMAMCLFNTHADLFDASLPDEGQVTRENGVYRYRQLGFEISVPLTPVVT